MSSNQYWAIAAETKDIHKKIDDYFKAMMAIGHMQKIQKSHYYYYGKGGASTNLQTAGEKGELTKVCVNTYRSILQHVITLTTQQRPSFAAKPINTDYKSQAQALTGDNILDYYLKVKGAETHLKDSTEKAVVYSEGFVWMDWDANAGDPYTTNEAGEIVYTGDIKYSTKTPFDVIRSPYRVGEQDWNIVKNLENRWDLIAQFPEWADEISKAPKMRSPQHSLETTFMANASDDDDLVEVIYLLHRKTKAVPEGRYVRLCGDARLLDTVLPFSEIPVYRIAPANLEGTCFGYSQAFDLLSLQEAGDSLMSAVLTNNLAFATQNLQVSKDADIEVNDVAKGMRVFEVEDGKEIKSLQLTRSAPETYQLMAQLKGEQQELSGINEVIRGAPSPNLRSGNALALIAAQAIVFNSGLQQAYNLLLESVGTSTFRFLQRFATLPRYYSIVGKHNRGMLKQFVGADIESIDRVIVEQQNPIAKTLAGKVAIAESLLQNQLIDADTYIMVLETGNLSNATENTRAESLLIRAENEKIAEGYNPPVMICDNHRKHMAGHTIVASDIEARMNSEVMNALTQHMQLHIDALQNGDPVVLEVTGNQPLPPKAAPQNAKVMNQQPALAEAANNMPALPAGSPDIMQAAYSQLNQPLNK